jgi:hypothetical protein
VKLKGRKMNNESKYIKWYSISISIFCLLLTLSGCSSIRENERELTHFEQSKNTKTGTFSFQRIPNKNSNHKNYSNKLLNPDSTHFYFESNNFKEKTSVYFYIHPNYFEENFKRYSYFLNILKGEVNLYIYTKVPNIDLLQQVISTYFSKNFQHQILNIHSEIGIDISILSTNLITLNSLVITGNATSVSVDKSITIKEIYLYPTDRFESYQCNLDSTITIYSEGVLQNSNVIKGLISETKNLQTLDLRKSNLKEMPDMSHLQRMDMIKFIDQNIEILDLNKLPNQLRALKISNTMTRRIEKNTIPKKIKVLDIRNSMINQLDGSLLNIDGLENVFFYLNLQMKEPNMNEFKDKLIDYYFNNKKQGC